MIIPKTINPKVTKPEYPNEIHEKLPFPKNPYLKVSIRDVIGFSTSNHLYFAGAADNG